MSALLLLAAAASAAAAANDPVKAFSTSTNNGGGNLVVATATSFAEAESGGYQSINTPPHATSDGLIVAHASAGAPDDELLPTDNAVRYSNVKPRVDTAGAIIDGHDGNYVYDVTRKKWFAFLMGYGLCNDTGTVNGCNACGGSKNNTVGIWSNTVLGNEGWLKEGEVLPYAQRPAAANGTWYRSHGVYSKFTKKWVVWINAQGAPDCLYGYACYLTATADLAVGETAILRHPSLPYKSAFQ